MKVFTVVALIMMVACVGSGQSLPATSSRTPSPGPISAATSPAAANVPPPGSERIAGGCGRSDIYKGGRLPDWASVNAPQFALYVVATPGLAIGYLFTYPLTAGANANTKVLWYVATPRAGSKLIAEGHPLGATEPIARFSKAADSSPGEIYPTGPTVPSAGCWLFTFTWQDGAQRAEVELLFV